VVFEFQHNSSSEQARGKEKAKEKVIFVQHEPFDFDKEDEPTEWCVDGLIPAKTLTDLYAQTGVGKSWFVEYLAVCIVYGHDFLGFKVKPHSVLFIDQDTSTDVLHNRLRAFSRYMKSKGLMRKYRLYVESMKGYSLENESLIKKIDEYKSKVVIIDCLSRIVKDTNSTKDMNVLSDLRSAVIGKGKTLILVHHISSKANLTIDQIMTMENPSSLSMGNSVISQIADTEFVCGSKHRSKLRLLYVRPNPKRLRLETEPFIAELIEKEEGNKKFLHFVMKGAYKNNPQTFELDKDIITFFKEKEKELGHVYRPQFYQVVLDMGSMETKAAIRGALKRLIKAGRLILHKRHRRLFVYELSLSERNVA
jgi:RecA-family ATPase